MPTSASEKLEVLRKTVYCPKYDKPELPLPR
jgi:hypothetical protein